MKRQRKIETFTEEITENYVITVNKGDKSNFEREGNSFIFDLTNASTDFAISVCDWGMRKKGVST